MNKIPLIRKLKYFLLKYKVHNFIPSEKLSFIGHVSMMSKWVANHRDLKHSTFPTKNFNYNNRYNLHKYIIENEIANQPIDYLEFGVSKGESFRWWIEHIKDENSSFYGFDTFTGLPEDWGKFKKGDMSNGNEPPKIDDSRHQFFQGLFQKTLYPFLDTYKVGKRKVIHLDADLYSSTLFLLTSISPYLRKGDILLFDEFNVPLHEFKAFTEWKDSFYIDYTVLGEVNNYYQVAMRIE